MSQMSANLTPCTPKAASMKGRLHVPRARPNEHPAMHQNDSRFDVRRSWQCFWCSAFFQAHGSALPSMGMPQQLWLAKTESDWGRHL